MSHAIQMAHGVDSPTVSQEHKWQRVHRLMDQHALTRQVYWLFQMAMRATRMVSCF